MIAIIFDLDGTLVDSSEGILDSLRHMLEAMSAPDRPDDELRSWIGPPLQYCAEHLAGATDAVGIETAVQAYRQRYRAHGVHLSKPFEGVIPLVQQMSDRDDVQLGVATSKPTEFAQQIIQQHGLDTLIPVVCGADWEGRLSKSDLVQQTLKQLRADPDASVMIGDRHYDIHGAHEHGLSAIGVTYGFGKRAELEEAGADIICDSVSAVRTALQNFLSL